MLAGGTLLSAYGNIKANTDQADEERKNADYYREQAAFAKKAGERQEAIFRDESEQFYKNQAGLFARNGVAMDETVLGDTIRKTREGIDAIRAETDANVRLALLRGQASDDKAGRLSSFGNNLLQAGGTILTGGGQILSRWPKSSGTSQVSTSSSLASSGNAKAPTPSGTLGFGT
jgi:hypothetical protein